MRTPSKDLMAEGSLRLNPVGGRTAGELASPDDAIAPIVVDVNMLLTSGNVCVVVARRCDRVSRKGVSGYLS